MGRGRGRGRGVNNQKREDLFICLFFCATVVSKALRQEILKQFGVNRATISN